MFRTAATPLSVPYANDFESTLTDFYNDPNNTDDWVIDTAKSSGTSSIKNHYSSNAENILTLPNPIDLSTYTNALLTFDQIAKTEGTYDYCYVEYSDDNGATWQVIPAAEYLGSSLDYATEEAFHEDSYTMWGTTNTTPTNAWWKTESFNLAGLGSGSIMIRFRLTSDGSAQREGWYIDNLSITNPSCAAPTQLGAYNISTTSAELYWTGGGAPDWNLEYGPQGFSLGNGTMMNLTNDTAAVSGLNPDTEYDFYVRDSCGMGNVSGYAGPYTFRTLCLTDTIPYLQDFDSGFPSCWSRSDATDVHVEASCDGRSNVLEFNQTEEATTASIDASGAQSIFVGYYIGAGACNNDPEDNEHFHVYYWDGSQWVMAKDYDGSWPQSLVWESFIVPQSALTSDFRVKFDMIDGTTDAWQIDSVVISEGPSCVPPSALGAYNITTSSADVFWTGGGASDWNVEYGPAGFTLGSGNMVNAGNDTLSISGLSSNTLYEFYVRDSCAVGDVSAWTGPFAFNTACSSFAIPFQEGFNSSSTTQYCWTVVDANSDNDTWDLDYTSNSYEGDEAAIMHTDFNSGSNDDWLISPEIVLTGAERLRYWTRAQSSSEPNDYELLISTTGSAPADFTTVLLTDTIDVTSYVERTIDLSAYTGAVRLAWHIPSGGLDGWRLYIDDVNVELIPTCAVPQSLGATNITSSTADIYWTGGGAADWNVEYGTSGFSMGSGTLVNATNDTLSIGSLNSNTTYDFYVRDSCGVGNVSAWVGPFSFTTLCAPFTAPYSEDFDGVTASDLPACWSVIQAATDVFTVTSTDHGAPIPSGPNAVEINDGSPAMLVSPEFSDLPSGLNQVRVKVAFEGPVAWPDTLFVGVMPDRVSDTAFVPIDTIVVPQVNNSFQQFVIPLSNTSLIGSNTFVAFAYADAGGGYEFYVDDFYYEAIPSCNYPMFPGVYNITSTSAEAFWTTGGASNWNLQYGSTGFSLGTGNMMNASNDTASLTGLTPNTTYDLYVRDSCGVGDVSGWTGPITFSTPCLTDTIPFLEDFSNGFSSCWSRSDATDVHIEASCDNRSDVLEFNQTEEATTVSIDASGAQSIFVGYYIGAGACNNDPENNEHFHVYYWDGSQWVLAKDYDGSWPQSFVWESFIVPPSALTSDFRVKFDMIDGTTDAWQIDSVVIEEGPACVPPGLLGAFNLTATSADLYWTGGGASDWNVEYGTLGFTRGSGTMVNSTNDTLSITGLSSNTTYEFYVRDSCGAGNVSGWSGPFAFTTPCAAFVAPYTESFDGSSTPACWSQSAGSGGPWEFTGSTNSVNCTAASDHTGNSGSYAWMDQSSTDAGVVLEMNNVDVSALTTPYLEFYYWLCGVGYTPPNPLYIETWDGNAWVTADSIIQATAGWEKFGFNLSSYTYGSNMLKVRFRAESGGSSNDFYGDNAIDDVSIIEAPSCLIPSALGYTALSGTSAEIYWTTGGATDWNVEYGQAGFTPGGGTMVNATNDTLTVSGLVSNMAYEFYVRDSCGVGDVSPWVGPFTFGSTITPCENFDAYTPGLIDPQSILINGWGGAGGDGAVSTDYANSGTNSLKIYDSGPAGFSDIVADVGVYNSGAWKVSMDLYIPAGFGGYYNILHNYQGASGNVWAIEVTLDSNGTATVDEGTNGTGTIGTYSFNTGAWNAVDHIIDLDNDTAWIEVNGVATSVGWQFSLGSTNFGNQFNAMNFYSSAPTGHDPLIYFDDFCITAYSPSLCNAPGLLGAFNLGTTTADIYWTTGGATDWNVEYGIQGFVQGNGTMINATNDTVSLAGLTANTCYDFYVRDSCGVGNVSTWTGPYNFCTQALPCTNTAGMDSTSAVCASNTSVDLSTYLRAADPGGTWVDMNATGALSGTLFDASMVTAGNSYVFAYYVTASGCPNDSALISLMVDPAPMAGADSVATVCETSTAVNLSTYLVGADAGGNWVDTAATGALSGMMLDASMLTPGASYNFLYHVASGTCADDSAWISLNVEAEPFAGADASDSLCDTAAAVDLSLYLSAGADAGGTWIDASGSGALSGSMFDPRQATSPGSYSFWYVVAGLACASDSSTVEIYVDTCTIGIDEYATGAFALYPNPTTDRIFIENISANSRDMKVEIHALNGRLIHKAVFDANEKAEIDLARFAAGLYSVKVSTDEATEIFRVIKK